MLILCCTFEEKKWLLSITEGLLCSMFGMNRNNSFSYKRGSKGVMTYTVGTVLAWTRRGKLWKKVYNNLETMGCQFLFQPIGGQHFAWYEGGGSWGWKWLIYSVHLYTSIWVSNFILLDFRINRNKPLSSVVVLFV